MNATGRRGWLPVVALLTLTLLLIPLAVGLGGVKGGLHPGDGGGGRRGAGRRLRRAGQFRRVAPAKPAGRCAFARGPAGRRAGLSAGGARAGLAAAGRGHRQLAGRAAYQRPGAQHTPETGRCHGHRADRLLRPRHHAADLHPVAQRCQPGGPRPVHLRPGGGHPAAGCDADQRRRVGSLRHPRGAVEGIQAHHLRPGLRAGQRLSPAPAGRAALHADRGRHRARPAAGRRDSDGGPADCAGRGCAPVDAAAWGRC